MDIQVPHTGYTPRVMSHLRRQLLWWRCDTYSVKLSRVDSQSQLLPYSRCCPLLYPSQPAGSISSCPQLTLIKVTHFVDPRSGSLVTLGHSSPSNNTHDFILNGILDSGIPPLLKTCSLMSLSPNPPSQYASLVMGVGHCCMGNEGCTVFLVAPFWWL